MTAKKTAKKTAEKKARSTKVPPTRRAAPESGVKHVNLNRLFRATDFKRADLIFTGVDHTDLSYEVRVFLNNRKGDSNTPRTRDNGYAGRFVVFGHGKCFGEEGHCDAEMAVRTDYDPIRRHPVTPLKRMLTITEPLRRISEAGEPLKTVTLVPVSKNPSRAQHGPTGELFKYKAVSLQTYR